MKPFSPDMLFWILAALAAVAGVASIWLVARSGKLPGMKLPAFSSRVLGLVKKGPFASLLESLRYLMTSREERYRAPWVLLVGEKDAGKSSLAHSCAAQLQDPCPPGKETIAIPGAEWFSFGGGDLIDPDGGMGTHGEKKWRQALDAIDMLRPERPIDKIVVVLNARTLMESDSDALLSEAKETLLQLELIQERFEFALPVYLVVTHCDAIAGFSAFWKAHKSALREQIFGWTAPPSIQSQPAEKWVFTAFSTLQEELRQLLYQAAASRENIDEVDQVFMFPVSFRRLSDPLARWFEVVFQPARWSQSFFARGIYFTGSPEAGGEVDDGRRADVAFVRDLFRERIFGEPHLAQPTRQSIWSRNRMIRRIQYAGLGSALLLLLALGVSAFDVSHKVATLESVLTSLKTDDVEAQLQTAESCQDVDSIEDLLRKIASLDSRSFYPAIPASWFDNRGRKHIAQQIAEHTFKDKIMPAIECRIRQKAAALLPEIKSLPASGADRLTPLKQNFLGYLGKVDELERNLDRFAAISRSVGQAAKGSQMRDFSELFAYAFDRKLPAEVSRERGIFSTALANFSYDKTLTLPSEWRKSYAKQIGAMSGRLRSVFDSELVAGAGLLENIDHGGPVQEDTGRLLWWLNWVRESWLVANPKQNPCSEINAIARPIFAQLDKHKEYAEALDPAADAFSERQCFHPSLRKLSALHAAPYGNMFYSDGRTLQLNPELGKEFSGLGAVMEMPYMRIEARPGFSCASGLSGWNGALLQETNGYAREYLNFVKSRKIAPADADMLYLRLARRQLDAVMSGSVNAAQLSSLASQSLAGGGALSAGERELMDESGKFHAVAPTLLETLDLYGQLGLAEKSKEIAQCARQQAADSLRRVYSLADESRLYDPSSVDSTFPLPGDIAVTRDWLSRQVARIKVLAGYATDYVSFLKNSQGLDEHLWSDDQDAAFWDNTISELDRYLQFKETNGQVAHVDDFFLKALSGVTAANCRDKLSAYQPPEYGNDLFSRLRRQRVAQADAQCQERRDAPAAAVYQIIADRFNRELSGRYPFASPDERDASLATVKAFLADYAAKREELRPLAESGSPKVRRFLQQMDAVAAFFAGSLSQSPASGPIRLGIHFDTLPNNSPGANQVISWTAASGDASVSDLGGTASLEWEWKPLEFRFTWASNSFWRPVAGEGMNVDGAAAEFAQSGPWSLIRMVQAHRMKPQPSPDPVSPERLELEFAVPVSHVGGGKGMTSRLHVALEFFDRKSAAALPLPPQFPYSAPAAIKE